MSIPKKLTIKQALSRAKKAVKQGDVSLAQQLYNLILKYDPQHPIAIKELRKLKKKLFHHQSSFIQPANPPENQISKLIDLYRLGRMVEVERQSKRLLEIYPQSLTLLNLLGAVLAGQGSLKEAASSYEKAIELKPDFAEAHNNLGSVQNDLGRLDEAISSYEKAIKLKPDFAEAHSNLGNALIKLSRFEEAESRYEKAIELKPNYAEAYNNSSKVLIKLGRFEEAVSRYEKAIELKPDFAEAYSNLGNVLIKLSRFDEAVSRYEKAIELKSDFAEFHSNLGNALINLNRFEEAVSSYETAIELKPNYAEANYNFGNALVNLHQFEEAVSRYEKAIELKPNYAEAYSNLGIALKQLEQLEESFSNHQKAVSIAPENSSFWSTFADCLQDIHFKSCSDDLVNILLQMLDQPTVHPQNLSKAVISALRSTTNFSRIAELSNASRIDKDIDLLTEQLSNLPLLLRIMELCPIADLELERMLSKIRSSMLSRVKSDGGETRGLRFYSAMAINCFINEYVFLETRAEKQEIDQLQQEVESILEKEEAVPPAQIAILGAYRPLSSFSWADDLLKFKWTDEINRLIIVQIKNVREEKSLLSKIPSFSNVENTNSKLVRDQYELNPYPRWVKTGLNTKPKTIKRILQEIGTDIQFDLRFPLQPDILVAGCGTGQHSLITASRFSDCNVLAIDLSLNSLSYAIRKTQELGITNVEYMQGDILKLNQLERQFDIIESTGVLHHMDDPLAGWEILLGRLRPEGLMKIALYSHTARQPIVEAHKYIKKKKYVGSSNDIRKFREDIINMDLNSGSEIKKIVDSQDFYSLSSCRDLLFHVQEHRFTLPQIEGILKELDLKFLGFELNNNWMTKFRKEHPKKDSLTSLYFWHEFEVKNPSIFSRMYQFWVQKK